ncbi:MAG TPA: YcxB family protein [Bacteroidia bacterium]|jgi:hypothetical protein|nr:YcxB family protein [Bacteroidia bacterium]
MKLNIDLTKQDYADFYRLHFLKQNLKGTIFFGVLILTLLEVYFYWDGAAVSELLICGIIMSAVYIGILFLAVSNAGSLSKLSGTTLGKREMELTEEQVTCNINGTCVNYAWKDVINFTDAKTAFYLYVGTKMAFIIPKRVFENSDTQNNFMSYVSSKLKTH